MILSKDYLFLDLCKVALKEGAKDEEEVKTKAALLKAVLEQRWSKVKVAGFEPVFHEDEFIGIQAKGV